MEEKPQIEPLNLPELDRFLTQLELEKQYSKYTLRNYGHAIRTFFLWLKKHENWPGDLSAIKKSSIREFIIESQRSHSRRTLHAWISALRTFYNYLIKQKLLDTNPFDGVILPKLKKTLPVFLTEKQMLALIGGPMQLLSEKVIDPFEAWRDRLTLELLYGGGLRISEVTQLRYRDIDPQNGVASVLGKGKKERKCPLGKTALLCLKEFRDAHSPKSDIHDLVLVTKDGKPYSPRAIQKMLKRYLSLAALPMDVTPHKIRHSYATHMLNRGANLRIVQTLMGHASLSTTQVYTHIDINRLKAVHAQAHPRS